MDLPQAVLFDFSGTLMRVEPADEWVRAVATRAELGLDNAQIAYWADKLETAGGHSGGAAPQRVPEYLRELWETRDLDEDRHHAAYTGLIRLAGWPWEGLVDALYDRANAAEAWHPYPDAVATLESLRDIGIKTGLISNISWDARLPLAAAGLLPLLDTVVLSYEAGFAKPDPRIFALACERLDVKPADSVMVGDHDFDGGGQELGIRTLFVEHLPVGQRPHALADIVRQLTS